MTDQEILDADRKTLTAPQKAKQTKLRKKAALDGLPKEQQATIVDSKTEEATIVTTTATGKGDDVNITTDVAVIEVLTPEQIKILPKQAKEDIVFLTEVVGAKQLAILNPLASGIIDIRTSAKLLKYDAEKEGNEQEFTDIRKNIRTYRAALPKEFKSIKEVPTKINKACVAIEKALKQEADDIMELVELKGKPYADAKAEKDRIAQEKKDELANKAINEANASANEAQAKAKVSALYSKIRYEIIAKISRDATSSTLKSSEVTLQTEQDELLRLTYKDALQNNGVEEVELDILSIEQRTLLIDAYNDEISLAKDLYSAKLDQYANDRKHVVESAKTEQKIETLENPLPQQIEEAPSNNIFAKKLQESHAAPMPPAPAHVPAPPTVEAVAQMLGAEIVPQTDAEFVQSIFNRTCVIKEDIARKLPAMKNPDQIARLSALDQMYTKMVGYMAQKYSLTIKQS